MNLDSLKLYTLTSGLPFPKTYRGKIMLIAFIGTHIPLIALIVYAVFSHISSWETIISTLVVTLIATLAGTTATLYVLDHLLSPITLTSETLRQYLKLKRRTDLPTHFRNEVGTLMADTNRTLKQLDDEILNHLTDYDNLTGLPNRELFQTHLLQAISDRENQQFALIVLDINSLKEINSTLGRKFGDLLLRKVAQRIISYKESGDILARFGGDEFAILRTNITNSDGLITLSNKLLNSLSQPFSLYGRKTHCAVKIGITTYPLDGNSIEQLLQNADTAIHQAPQQNLNTYQVYSSAIYAELERILAIKENLHYALEREEFSICYQPRIEVATNRVVAVEALLRWQNSELGWVSPAEFIPIAEETNLIIPISEWMLYNACLQNKQWQQEGVALLGISVNLSVCQLKQASLVETIERVLKDTDLDVAYLELEITESLLVKNMDKAIAILQKLRQRGVSIALDDFGTGCSSLSYVQKLPINTLKIDRSFVTNIASRHDDAVIAKSIIELAQRLELNITAEGVETQAQLEYLQDRGCHEVQGYYFTRPLPGDRTRDFLLTYNAR